MSARKATFIKWQFIQPTQSVGCPQVDIGLAFALIGVFWGDPGTGGRSRLRRIAWTPSAVREAEILAQGIAKSR